MGVLEGAGTKDTEPLTTRNPWSRSLTLESVCARHREKTNGGPNVAAASVANRETVADYGRQFQKVKKSGKNP